MEIDFGRDNLTKILVAIDFDGTGEMLKVSRQCVDEALRTAGQKVSSIVYVHVAGAPEQLKDETHWREGPACRYRKILRSMDDLVTTTREVGIPAKSLLSTGVPWFGLVQAAQNEQADLLLAGSGKPASLWRTVLGSTTTRLLRKCPCPVWVSRPDARPARESILVAHDLKDAGKRALTWAAALAGERGCPLTVLHVFETSDFGLFRSNSSKPSIDEARRKVSLELQSLGFSGSAEVLVEEGSPATRIQHHLQRLSSSLLVLGAVARSGLSGFLTGSTVEALLPQVKCSLVVVKPEVHSPAQARSAS